MSPLAIHWFRRDLRLHDNTALFHALQSGLPVLCVFIFDSDILDRLEDKKDKRVQFIHNRLEELNAELISKGSSLVVRHGRPEEVWKSILADFSVQDVYANGDYEPYAIARDHAIAGLLKANGAGFHSFKDHVVLEKNEVTKDDGGPYTVYTPYMKKWRSIVESEKSPLLKSYSTEKHFADFYKMPPQKIASLNTIGFQREAFAFPGTELPVALLKNYAALRDLPAVKGTTHLGMHLRFGTVSIREVARKAWKQSETWVNELIWREFFIQVLWHFPHVKDHAFKKAYDRLRWRQDETGFKQWCEGKTGYPIVDAGMRELNATGFMHNRVRMLTACFLSKYLLIDWRWGEAYFGQKLLDYELASNNGNWQWSAGTGCDAAPYFRIFNMEAQTKKFDPDFKYIKKWVPEVGSSSYPKPIVEYAEARRRCLEFFKRGLR